MRSTARWMLHMAFFVILLIHPHRAMERRRAAAVVHFPDENNNAKPETGRPVLLESSPAAWRFQDGQDNQLTRVAGSTNEQATGGKTPGQKKGRKASADVQDIISGIVHLLGGKVNLAASSSDAAQPANQPPGTTVIRPQMLAPSQQSTRINNRAPPRLAEVPFEAIPLELGNSAGQLHAQPQLPFGIPLRPPVFPPAKAQGGQNIQDLPFTSGIPLPVQLVPPVSHGLNRPWQPPQEKPLTTTTDAPSSTTTEKANVSKVTHPAEATTISFFPEDHAVRHPPNVVHVPPSTPVYETSSLDSILQPSIEDVSTSTPAAPPSTPSSSSTVSLSTSLATITSSAVVPQVESGSTGTPPPTPFSYPSYTPPLPSAGPRPGQVFHDEYMPAHPISHHEDVDVITSDNIHPTYGETFELVVTAAQNFAPALQDAGSDSSAPAIIPGRPYVIPVNINGVREPVQPSLPSQTDADDPDQYVSIDGRKTYFNLFPTDIPEGPVPAVQATSLPVASNGHGYAYPSVPNAPLKAQPAPVPSRPTRPPPTRPTTPMLIRRTTTPIGRIDACIVGDPNACLEPNESCQAEVDGAACSCKPGFGRKKPSDVCKALAGFLVSLRLDRLDDERLSWSPSYTDPSSVDYKQLEWEANQAINSMMEMTQLSPHYVKASVNKFYSVGGDKLVVNATVFMDQSPETQSVTVRPTLQKQLASLIQQRNYNLGLSRLWVDSQSNPIPAVLDLNECGSPELNDCSPDAECVNTPGSFTCQCRPGFSDPAPPNDVSQVGRQCNSCTRSDCNNRGECRIDDGGRKVCKCLGNYKGQQCELDGEVLGVAIGASVAAVIIILLTLVLLCMWSRRWRQNQDKMMAGGAAGHGYMDQLKSIPFPAMMGMQADRIRWAQYAEAVASAHNLYATMIPPNQPQVPSLPPFFYSTLTAHPVPTLPTTSAEGANPSAAPNPPPPVPPRNSKTPIRQAASLPLSAISDAMTSTANAANQVVSNIQQLARRISRKKNPAPQPDPVSVNPHLALISPAGYPMGTLSSLGRASMAPTLPMGHMGGGGSVLGGSSQFRARSTTGSVHSYGKRSAPPPPPSNPPPALQVTDGPTSEESAAESDAPIHHQQRPFHVPRPRSRVASAQQQSENIYYDADAPGHQLNDGMMRQDVLPQQPPRPAPRYFYR